MQNNRTGGQTVGRPGFDYIKQAIQLVAKTLTRSWPSNRPV